MICVSLSASIFVFLVKMQGDTDKISDDYKQLDCECKVP